MRKLEIILYSGVEQCKLRFMLKPAQLWNIGQIYLADILLIQSVSGNYSFPRSHFVVPE